LTLLDNGIFHMAFKISQGSLFAVLLRSPWWYSVLVGFFLIGLSAAVFGGQYVALGIFSALPFFGIAGFSGFKQSQRPSQKRMLEVDQMARKIPARQIAEKIAESYIEKRYDSRVFSGKEAELELERGNRKLLLCSKRFKAANTGVEPLKQLVSVGENVEATGYLYVALGDISAPAWDYAQQNDIELIQADRLAAFFDGQARID